MKISERKETTYSCDYKTKGVNQSITVSHKDVPFQIQTDFNNCVTDINDIKLLYEFLGEFISEFERPSP